MAGILADILKAAEEKGLDNKFMKVKIARTWYQKQAEQIQHLSEANVRDWIGLKKVGVNKLKNRLIPGTMVLFIYDAKTKNDLKGDGTHVLPYWDRFPIIFPIETYDDGFLGINFHYLPHNLRAKLMDALLTLAYHNKYDDEYRLRVSYEILKSATKFRYFKPCVKRYLYKQIRSDFFDISYKEWPVIVFLPVERFRTGTQFASTAKVWADSRKILGE